jgi:formyltetrahydrofolate hydrolase
MLKNKAPKILLLATASRSTNIFYHSVNDNYQINKVIIESKEKKVLFIKRRINKLGFLKVIDQLLFSLIVDKILSFFSKKRYNDLILSDNLLNESIDFKKITNVNSINSSDSIELVNKYSPDIILLSGTRILSKELLESTSALILNIHAGVTPYFRGVHGAYWAVFNNHKNLAGVTLHRVDTGIDTGKIIDQRVIKISEKDNYSTYPILQLSLGLDILNNFLSSYCGNMNYSPLILKSDIKSKLWYHPGMTQYLYNRFLYGIK